jgi:hypothetical protein
MFPIKTVSPDVVSPLSVDQFFTNVLVPEAALLLIKEDMSLNTREDAIQVMQESKEYGIMMFSEQAQPDDVAEIGEKFARERAQEQRKLLEEMHETDADIKRQVEKEEREARRKESSRAK